MIIIVMKILLQKPEIKRNLGTLIRNAYSQSCVLNAQILKLITAWRLLLSKQKILK